LNVKAPFPHFIDFKIPQCTEFDYVYFFKKVSHWTVKECVGFGLFPEVSGFAQSIFLSLQG